jgi:hypothetical protein
LISRKEATKLFKKANVTMVGMGKNKVIVGVTTKMPVGVLRKKDVIPAYVGGILTDVIQTGKIKALQARTDKWRPAPGGVSIGHHKVTAGTLGGVVVKNGSRMILSNNHVLADSNDAEIGDSILQPGSYDGGGSNDKIALLHSFVPIVFDKDDSGCLFSKWFAKFWNLIWWVFGRKTRFRTIDTTAYYNKVDAALALPIEDGDIRDDILDIGVPKQFGEVALGDKVVKSGRTTAYTEGTVTAINAYVQVGYGGGKRAYFEDQIVTTYMLAGGDSGSWLLVKDKETVVGLCFAGSSETGVMNRMTNVRNELGGFELP